MTAKKLILLITLLPVATAAYGQKPDDDAIRTAVEQVGSRYYYPRLMERYRAGDPTLDGDDYRHLYYGYAFSDGYRPLDPVRGQDELLAAVEAGIDSVSAPRIIELAGVMMDSDPFNPTAINLQTYAYGLLGDADSERKSASRLAGVFGAIGSSGDGETEKTAWHVIWFPHVNDFLVAKGHRIRSRTVVGRTTELVMLRDSERRNRGLYFDFGRIYLKPPTVEPERPKGLKLKI